MKKKDEELKKFKDNATSQNGIKFEADCKEGEYDIIININSFQKLIKEGWSVKYNNKGKDTYLKKKNENTIVVGVIGNGNKGKSFLLEKLLEGKIPKGFNVKTEGLSLKYGTAIDHNVAILDSAGQETPLLKKDEKKGEDNKINEEESNHEPQRENGDNNLNDNKKKINNNVNNIQKDNNEKVSEESKKDEETEFELYSRDKLITEYFLQKFIIWKSDVLILVVGNITLTEQKLLQRVTKAVETLGKQKEIYVVHNLKEYSTKEQVDDYIENTLKKLYKIEIEENNIQNITRDNNYNEKSFNKYFREKDKNVNHLIFINEYDNNNSNFYNDPTKNFLQKEIEQIKTRKPFSIIDDIKNFLKNNYEELMEEFPNIENFEVEEGEKEDRIVLKNVEKITLKRCFVDEMGYTLNNNEIKYSYYIKLEDKKLYINLELAGGGKINRSIASQNGFYYFTFEGIKNGDKLAEENQKDNSKELSLITNFRKSHKFKLVIKISNSDIQIIPEQNKTLKNAGTMITDPKKNDTKGVYTFSYNIIDLRQKGEGNENEEIEL